MKTLASLLMVAIGCAALSACGGYPMTVESRTPPSATTDRQTVIEQKLREQRQLERSRGNR